MFHKRSAMEQAGPPAQELAELPGRAARRTDEAAVLPRESLPVRARATMRRHHRPASSSPYPGWITLRGKCCYVVVFQRYSPSGASHLIGIMPVRTVNSHENSFRSYLEKRNPISPETGLRSYSEG